MIRSKVNDSRYITFLRSPDLSKSFSQTIVSIFISSDCFFSSRVDSCPISSPGKEDKNKTTLTK